MTAEQLEELLGKVSPYYEGNDWWPEVGYDGMPVLDADLELIALAPSLARRVIAAEKLVGHYEECLSLLEGEYSAQKGTYVEMNGDVIKLRNALTAYREANQ